MKKEALRIEAFEGRLPQGWNETILNIQNNKVIFFEHHNLMPWEYDRLGRKFLKVYQVKLMARLEKKELKKHDSANKSRIKARRS